MSLRTLKCFVLFLIYPSIIQSSYDHCVKWVDWCLSAKGSVAGVLPRPGPGCAWLLTEAVPQCDSHKHDLREQWVLEAAVPAVSRGEGKREELRGKRVSTPAWQAARAWAQQPVCDISGAGRFNLVRESGGKVTLALSGPPHAHLPCPDNSPYSGTPGADSKRGSCPSRVKYITQGPIFH